jgi:hypothetical protein
MWSRSHGNTLYNASHCCDVNEIECEANRFACRTIQPQILDHLYQGKKVEDVHQYNILTV